MEFTIALASTASRLNSVLLPTLGRPMMAMENGMGGQPARSVRSALCTAFASVAARLAPTAAPAAAPRGT